VAFILFDSRDTLDSIIIGNPGKIVSDKGSIGYIDRTVEVLE